MIIDLTSFLDKASEFLPVEGEISLGSIDLKGRDVSISEPLKFKGEIFRLDGQNTIQLKIFYKFGESCNRCLTYTTKDVVTSLYGTLYDESQDLDEDNDEIIFYENYKLNLREYILSQVILSLPMTLTCSPDCRGLCPTCGVNLNNSKCNCVNESIDPRLEVLKKFFPKD